MEEKKSRPAGTGQCISVSKNRYKLIVFLGYHADGKKRYFKKTVQCTHSEAEARLRRLLRLKDEGALINPSPLTVSEYLDQYVETSAKSRWCEGTVQRYSYMIGHYIKPTLGRGKLSQLKSLDIQKLYTELTNKGIAPRTIQIVHSILNGALKQAVKWQILASNPAERVDKPKQVRKEMQALSPEQTVRFMAAARTDKYFPFFALMIDSGARPSELLGLQWKDIDWDGQRMRIQRSLYFPEGGQFSFKGPKTQGSRRAIQLAPTTLLHLKEHRQGQAERRLKLGAEWNNHDLVFSTRNGLPLLERNLLRRHHYPILKKAGLPRIRLYDLRHTCATLLLATNTNVKVVSERLGHASVALTLDIYSHVLPSMQVEAANKLNHLLYA